MSLAPYVQWLAFAAFALFSIGGALGMATTMSMFRSGIFLMASFIGVAGLFILLSADLLGLLQVMMYIGGMLVMILFMVLFMQDPGGSMMASMEMDPIASFFTRGIKPEEMEMDGGDDESDGAHEEMQHNEDGAEEDDGMGGMDMSMTTPIKQYAALLALAVGGLLSALLLLRSPWPISSAAPDPRSAEQVGLLLMDKYMMAFEGAGLLILTGIVGAVYLARAGRFPDREARTSWVAIDKNPAPISEEKFTPPFAAPKDSPDLSAADVHQDHPEDHA